MACQCENNQEATVVCDPCAARMMSALMDPLPNEAQIEATVVFTLGEHRGMMRAVNGWLDELEVAVR